MQDVCWPLPYAAVTSHCHLSHVVRGVVKSKPVTRLRCWPGDGNTRVKDAAFVISGLRSVPVRSQNQTCKHRHRPPRSIRGPSHHQLEAVSKCTTAQRLTDTTVRRSSVALERIAQPTMVASTVAAATSEDYTKSYPYDFATDGAWTAALAG